MTGRARALRLLRSLLRALAFTAGALLLIASLLAVAGWALGTRGVPFTARIAERVLHDQLTVREAEGGWFGPITLKGLVYRAPGATVEIDTVTLDYQPRELLSRRLHVIALTAGQVTVTLTPHPESPPQPLSTRLPLNVWLDALQVRQLVLVQIDGERLQFDSIDAAARWQRDVIALEHLRFSEARAGPISASGIAQMLPKGINFAGLQVSGPGLLTAQGRLGLQGEPSALEATLSQGRWPIAGTARVQVPALAATLKGVIAGGTRDAVITLKGALRTALDEKANAARALGFDLDAAVHLQTEDATVERLALVSHDGAGTLTAQGHAQWKPALRVDALATLKSLDPGVLLPDWKGKLNGTFKAETEGRNDPPDVRFTADIHDSVLRGYPLSLDARGLLALQGTTRRLTLDALTLKSGSATLDARGAVWPALDAQAQLRAPDLKALLPTLAGAAQLDATAKGDPKSPAVKAKGQLRALRWETLSLASADVDADIDPARTSHLQLTLAGLQQDKTQLTNAKLVLDGRLEQHRLALDATLANPKTSASLVLQGRADLATRRWQGQLVESRLLPPAGPPWQQAAPAALALSAEQQSLTAACWQTAEAARLCLDANRQQPRPAAPAQLALKTTLAKLDLAAFAALLPPSVQLRTVLDGHADVTLAGHEPQALDVDLASSAGTLRLPNAPAGTPVFQLKPGHLTLRQVGAEFQAKANLAVDQGSATVDATVPVAGEDFAGRALAGNLALDVPDLAVLQPFVKGATDLAGRLEARFALAGTLAAPRAQGAATLANGKAKLTALGIAVTDISARIDGNSTEALGITASATSGKGVLQVKGTARFPDGKPTIELAITGSNVQVADMADARVWASPDLKFQQNAEGLSLTGTVNIPKADITPRKIAGNAIGASTDQVLVGADAPKTANLPLTANVTVALGDAVTFEGFGLKSRVDGEVTAIDTPGGGGTRGRGELRLIDAVYRAYGQELKLETGRILFNGGLLSEPTVDLRASRQPREGISVSLHVRGSLDQPSFDLSSSPPMPREQQLGWLLFGRPIDSGGQLSGAAAALSLGLAGGDALANRFGSLLGLDQVSVGADADSTAWKPTDPNVTSTAAGTTEQTRFTVGKYLSPKLFVSYGVGLFQNNGNVLRLIYDLGHGFKLRTESGLETGGDVLYSREH